MGDKLVVHQGYNLIEYGGKTWCVLLYYNRWRRKGGIGLLSSGREDGRWYVEKLITGKTFEELKGIRDKYDYFGDKIDDEVSCYNFCFDARCLLDIFGEYFP